MRLPFRLPWGSAAEQRAVGESKAQPGHGHGLGHGLALVAVLVLLLLRKYTQLEFVGHARLLLKTWSVRLGAAGASAPVGAASGCCASRA